MAAIDYTNALRALAESGDSEAMSAGTSLRDVFGREKVRPPAGVLERESEIVAAVRASFPTPFARQFDAWSAKRAAFEAALDDDAADVNDAFNAVIVALNLCWRQLVHYVPFVLMVALRRLPLDAVKAHGGSALGTALALYQSFYAPYDDGGRRVEADQRELLTRLLAVFRTLSARGALDESFVLHPLIEGGRTFADLFPERFGREMEMLQTLRNREQHGLLGRRRRELLEPIHALAGWALLDIVDMLRPLFTFLSFSYVEHVDVERKEARALTFAGLEPVTETFGISLEPLPDELKFEDHRLYCIRRDRSRERGYLGELAIDDYLDMTPLLVADLGSMRDALGGTEVFGLKEYHRRKRNFTFLELAATHECSFPPDAAAAAEATPGAKRELERLIREAERFVAYASEVGHEISAPRTGMKLAAARARLWELSGSSARTLIDTSRYDDAGRMVAEAATDRLSPTYEEELFVAPPEAATVAAFLESPERGLMLVGRSGFGKSNLLAHAYLSALGAGKFAALLTARSFDSPAFATELTEKIARGIDPSWKLADLQAFLESFDQELVIFVDALNEFSGRGGALALVRDLIDAITDANVLRRIKVVATCRTETWAQYKVRAGAESRPLDPRAFLTTALGDAVAVTGFESEATRADAFGRYRARYDLSPTTYAELSPPVRALVAQPFMLSLVAETYANRGREPGERRLEIGRRLDYYHLFDALTERKIRDAENLLPARDEIGRSALVADLYDFLERFSDVLYERLRGAAAGTAGAATNLDALPMDVLAKEPRLQPFVRAQSDDQTIALDAARQVGLLDLVSVPEPSRSRPRSSGGAFAFFHDQYAQFWLADVYQRVVLGDLSPQRLANPATLATIADAVEGIVTASETSPVLAGALEHWLHKNILANGGIAALVPLADRLAASDNPAVRYYASATLTNLIAQRAVDASELYAAAFEAGSSQLHYDLAGAYVDAWPGIGPDAVIAFIDACDPGRDPAPLERLADIFNTHFTTRPAEVGAYLDDVLSPLSIANAFEAIGSYIGDKLPALPIADAFDTTRTANQLRFTLQFLLFSIMARFDDPPSLEAMRTLFRAKYRLMADLIVPSSSSRFSLRALTLDGVRLAAFRKLDEFAISQWNQFVGSMEMSANELAWEENEGVVQRDVMREYLPYALALHAGDLARLSLEPGAPFRDLALRMLSYRVTSVIGYNAVLALPSLLRRDWPHARAFVLDLIGKGDLSSLYFGNLLLTNLAYTEPALSEAALALIRDEILPLELSRGLRYDWSMLQALCIAALDVERHGAALETILQSLFDHFTRLGDAAQCELLGEELFKASFYHDVGLGGAVIDLMVRGGLLEHPLWRTCTLRVFASMLVRSPGTLRDILETRGIDERELRHARAYVTEEIVLQSRRSALQVVANRYVAWLMADEPRLRRIVVEHVVGGFALSAGLPDFARGFRRFLVGIIGYYFGDAPPPARAEPLSLADVERSSGAKTR